MLEAIFISGIDEIKISGLTQWDRGQMVQIICPDLPSAFQVHFAKRKEKTTVVVQAESSGNAAIVAIPDILLQEPFDLYAYLYFDEGLTGETVKTIRFPIKPRQKPDDYVIDLPQEQLTDAEKIIIEMMDDYVDEVADHIVEEMQVEVEILEDEIPAYVNKEVDNGVTKLVFGIPMPEATVEAENAAAAAVRSAEMASVSAENAERFAATATEGALDARATAGEVRLILTSVQLAEATVNRNKTDVESLASNVEANAKIVEDFAENMPVVTDSDNGKVLTVVNGSWTADDEILVQMGLIVEIVEELIGKFPGAATFEFEVYHQYLNDYEGGTVTYEAEDGMTWAEWVASDYNTSGFRADEWDVRDANYDVLFTNSEDYVSVNQTDVIIAGHSYYCESDGS